MRPCSSRALLVLAALLLFSSPASAAPAHVSSSALDALSPGDGDFVTLEVGTTRDLTSLTVEAVPSADLAVSGRNPAALGPLERGETREVSFWVSVEESAEPGLHGLQIRLTGAEASGDTFTEERRERVMVANPGGGPEVTADSATLSPGGEGTVTVAVTARGRELRDAAVRLVPREEGGVSVVGLASRRVGDIAPGDTVRTRFTVAADEAEEGVHGFTVALDHSEASVTRGLGVEVDGDPDLVVSAEAKATAGGVRVRGNVSNVGTGAADGLVLTLGNDTAALGSLAPGASRPFFLDASLGTSVVAASYRTDGKRVREEFQVPGPVPRPSVAFSEVDVTREGGRYALTGTISNRGSSDAFGLLIRVRNTSGATPVYPARSYYVGSLAPDDFATFDLTFRSNGAERVEVAVEYEHGGRGIRHSAAFPVPRSSVETRSSGVPATALYGVLILAGLTVLGAVAYTWRG